MLHPVLCIVVLFQMVTQIKSSICPCHRNVKDCAMRLTHDPRRPLFFNPETHGLIYPHLYEENYLIFAHGSKVRISCPGSHLLYLPDMSVLTECNNNILLTERENKTILQFTPLRCKEVPENIIRKTGETCELNGSVMEIGYQYVHSDASGEFLFFFEYIRICFKMDTLTPLYTEFTLSKEIGFAETSPRPSYYPETIFKDFENTLEYYYLEAVQVYSLEKQLGLYPDSDKYMRAYSLFVYVPAHLAGQNDFVYSCMQISTYRYSNTAPQWKVINEGNWLKIEDGARRVAVKASKDLKIYTGTYGILTLPHITGDQVEMYLYVYQNTSRKIIPVPRYFWKVIYEPESKAGIALVVVNNPHLDEYLLPGNIICDSVITETVSWLSYHWKPKNFTLGYAYACEVSVLNKTLKYLPPLDVQKVLTHVF